MRIKKRSGEYQKLSPDKVLYRIRNLCRDTRLETLNNIDPDIISLKVIQGIFDGVSSAQLDELAAQISISMITDHPEYGELASRIIISNMHKNTSEYFSEVMEKLYQNKDIHNEQAPLISD